MKIAIMQPYFFPYIGYFQLICSADKFVFYDDVAFIKQGWINRNNILMNGKAHLFTIPVMNISSFETIHQTQVAYQVDWTKKFLKTIESSYSKSPFYKEVFPRIAALIDQRHTSISDLAKKSIALVFEYLSLPLKVETSQQYNNSHLKAQERIIDICSKEKAGTYINPPGGRELYDAAAFEKEGIELKFIEPKKISYDQYSNVFVPFLSMIDVLMFNDPGKITQMLGEYELISGN
jgi:hypothetical protein